LIIDEINRGNVSRVFGELITLVEASKRKGMPEALEVVLPYSKKPFSVPKNVYLIGTMNTADRSLTGLDIALRRRFSFVEVPPQPELLDEIVVEDIGIGDLLRVINARIEVLLDRDHRIGHTYFMPLKGDASLPLLATIFRRQILPLLEEYFFEDWSRIRLFLNDHRKKDGQTCFIKPAGLSVEALFGQGDDLPLQNDRWTVNDEAFKFADSYRGIIHA
jgi:5-methylcytosine-specific restriction protein B